MKNSLGIRVSGENVFLCILKSNKDYIYEQIILPKVFDLPNKLKYLRFNLIDILDEYEIKFVSLKVIEFNSRNFDLTRCFIEGVIQETLASSTIDSYTIDKLQNLSKKLKLKTDIIKLLISNNDNFFDYLSNCGFDKLIKPNKEKRESFLLALSSFKENT
jgi:hypothetical protein